VIDVQLSDAGLVAAVLAAIAVAKKEIPAGEADPETGSAVVSQEVQNPRDPETPPDHGELIIRASHREVPPSVEIVRVATLVDGERDARE
jgi:hypothetical protein